MAKKSTRKSTTKKGGTKRAAKAKESPELLPPVGVLDEDDRRLILRGQELMAKVITGAKGQLERLDCTSPELGHLSVEAHRLKKMCDDAFGGDDRRDWSFDDDRREVAVWALMFLVRQLDKTRDDQLKLAVVPNDTDRTIVHAKELAARINGTPLDFGEDTQGEFGSLETTEPVPGEGDDLPDGPSMRMGSIAPAGKPAEMSDAAWEASGRRPHGGLTVERGGHDAEQ